MMVTINDFSPIKRGGMKRLIAISILFLFSLGTVNAATLGVSYDQVMEYISKHIEMGKSTSVEGNPRYMGLNLDETATLEIIGDKRNITKTTLDIGLPSDSTEIVMRNTELMMRFLKNTCPEWPSNTTWATNSIQRFRAGISATRSIVYGYKRISMQWVKGMAWLSITIEPVDIPGNFKSNVEEIQLLLNSYGYNAGPEDGIVGPKTVRAVRAFQRDAGLPVDGEISEVLLRELRRRR